jgi:hypothetical protein
MLRLFLSRSTFFLCLIGIGSSLNVAGCAKGQIIVSEAEQEIQKIDGFLLDLREDYAKKDMAALRSKFSSGFQIQYPELFSAVRKTFEETEKVRLDFTMDVIHKDREHVNVLLHWDVNTTSDNITVQHRGNTALQLQEGETFQIVALKGDNPFILGGLSP